MFWPYSAIIMEVLNKERKKSTTLANYDMDVQM
jgi:hypothetical protein